MEHLLDLSLKDYNLLLASDAPAPGGGAAAALAGAQGMALSLMVINLTVGKEKYAQHETLCKEIKLKAEEVMLDLMAGIDKDKDAFSQLSEAYKLPKSNEEEKTLRLKAIGQATIYATEVPLEAMDLAVRGLELTQPLLGNSNNGAVSDLGVAATNLLTCAKSAWLNVLINLPGIKDENLSKEFKIKAEKYMATAQSLADEIYDETRRIICQTR